MGSGEGGPGGGSPIPKSKCKKIDKILNLGKGLDKADIQDYHNQHDHFQEYPDHHNFQEYKDHHPSTGVRIKGGIIPVCQELRKSAVAAMQVLTKNDKKHTKKN